MVIPSLLQVNKVTVMVLVILIAMFCVEDQTTYAQVTRVSFDIYAGFQAALYETVSR